MTIGSFNITAEDLRTYSSFKLKRWSYVINGSMNLSLDAIKIFIVLELKYDYWYLDFICQEMDIYQEVIRKSLTGTFINTGNNLDVYVMDSGIDYDHQEFNGRSQVLPNFIDEFSSGQSVLQGKDVTGSGTAIASIIGSKTFGVLKECNLYSVKIFNEFNEWTQTNLEQAVLKIIEHHTTKTTGNKSVVYCGLMEVPNASNFVIPPNNTLDYMQNAIKLLYDSGLTVICPAGDGYYNFQNENSNTFNAEFTRPARMDEVISVGSLNRSMLVDEFKSYGEAVDVWCPGHGIRTAWLSNTYSHMTSSKAAAALATGVIGSSISRLGNLHPDKIKKFIKDMCYERTISSMTYVLNNDIVIGSDNIANDFKLQFKYPYGTEVPEYPLPLGDKVRDLVLKEYFVQTNLYWATDEDLGTISGSTAFSTRIIAKSFNLYGQERNVNFNIDSGTNHEWLKFNKVNGALCSISPDTQINVPVTLNITAHDGIFKLTRTFTLLITPTPIKSKLEGFLCHDRGEIVLLNINEFLSEADYKIDEPFGNPIYNVKQPAYKLIRVFEHTTGLLVYETKSDISTGRFEVELVSGTYYIVASSIPGFDPIRQNSRVIDKITI